MACHTCKMLSGACTTGMPNPVWRHFMARLIWHALLGFLPWASVGIPRAMDGTHNWEMFACAELCTALAQDLYWTGGICDLGTTTVAQFYVPCKALFFLQARLLF